MTDTPSGAPGPNFIVRPPRVLRDRIDRYARTRGINRNAAAIVLFEDALTVWERQQGRQLAPLAGTDDMPGQTTIDGQEG